ncbi:MAG TPA: hypothetical protein DCY35_02465 [Prolixibacteraceae bacterium]|nr:hypothetical protein [Prolixibacteraceae bacterium]
MDDVIVIILTLVLTIVAAINQNKKKKGAPVAQKTPDFWETILGQENPLPQPVEVEKTSQPVRQKVGTKNVTRPKPFIKPESQRMRSSALTDELLIAEGGRHEDILSHVNSKKGIEDSFDNDEEISGIIDDFSLKKAVIYAEIIQPKYF